MQKPVLVIKLGSAVISKKDGTIDKTIIKKVAAEMGANYFSLKQLSKDQILRIVRNTQS